jgi:ribosomal protein S18 acetylase RimI-like enzyme
MINLPTAFDKNTTPLDAAALGETCQLAIAKLAEQNYEVQLGLTAEYAEQILAMASQASIKDYAPRDSSERFKDLSSTENWLSKGRAVFLLLRKTESETVLAGYGWTGPGSSIYVPGGENTFAIRISEADQGKGLATPFSRLLVFASHDLYGLSNLWLETWASNGGAVHVYQKIGFNIVKEVASQRLTLDGGEVTDTRLYMTLSNDLLN